MEWGLRTIGSYEAGVLPALRYALVALDQARPADPVSYMANKLLEYNERHPSEAAAHQIRSATSPRTSPIRPAGGLDIDPALPTYQRQISPAPIAAPAAPAPGPTAGSSNPAQSYASASAGSGSGTSNVHHPPGFAGVGAGAPGIPPPANMNRGPAIGHPANRAPSPGQGFHNSPQHPHPGQPQGPPGVGVPRAPFHRGPMYGSPVRF